MRKRVKFFLSALSHNSLTIWFFLISQCCFLSSSPLFGEDMTPQVQLQQIDEELEVLENQQLKADRRAARYQDEADRWQFDSNRFNDARYSRQQADQAKMQSQVLQRQIDALKEERTALIQKHPELLQANDQ